MSKANDDSWMHENLGTSRGSESTDDPLTLEERAAIECEVAVARQKFDELNGILQKLHQHGVKVGVAIVSIDHKIVRNAEVHRISLRPRFSVNL